MEGVIGKKKKFYVCTSPINTRHRHQEDYLDEFKIGTYFDCESILFLGWEDRHISKLFKEVAVEDLTKEGVTYISINEIMRRKNQHFLETEKKKLHGEIKLEKFPEVVLYQIDNYIDNVRTFFDMNPFFYDKSGIFWAWDEKIKCWSIIDEVDILNLIEEKMTLFGATVKSGVKSNYLEAFKRVGRQRMPEDASELWIQFKDKIHNLKTGEIHEATPDFFLTNPIPHECITGKETPFIDECFESWVGKDNVLLLKEIIAFCMMPKYFLHRIFCFIGSGRNGKSTYLDLVRRCIGDINCCSSDLDDIMGNRFEVAKLYKKLVCMMGETNFNTMGKTSKLKKLCGGDIIGFEFKNKNPFDAVNYAKLLISTNGLPQTTDKTEGFYRRWVLIDFPNKFSEKRDILSEVPPEEYAALCGQCIEIAQRLYKERQFTNEGTIKDRMERYEAHSNPLNKFIKEYCSEDGDSHIFKYEFRDRFEQFCKDNGYRAWNDKEVGLWMKANGYETRRKEANWHENEEKGKRYWAYVGISFITTTTTSLENNQDNIEKVGVNVQDVQDVQGKTIRSRILSYENEIGRHPGHHGQSDENEVENIYFDEKDIFFGKKK